jgi:hypothetical protein
MTKVNQSIKRIKSTRSSPRNPMKRPNLYMKTSGYVTIALALTR